MSITLEEQVYQEWQKSPITRHYSFSDKKLWAKQEEVLWSVRNNKYTAVKSGNTVGKSFVAADVVLDYLTIHQPSKVITTAPTWTQVEEILWKEIASQYHNAKIPYGGELLKTELSFSDDWFALGLSTNEVNRFQGFHSPWLLVVIDEALGVAKEIWEAIHGLHPHRILAIGNPLDAQGDFYECFQSSQWHKISISCQECVEWQKKNGVIPGLVTQEWIDDRAEEWGRASPLFQARSLGEFPEQGPDSLVNREWVERARKGIDFDDKPLDEETQEDNQRIGASDIASRHGSNETVIGYRYGHTIESLEGFHQIPMMQTRDKLAFLYNQKKLHNVVVDSDGLGEGLPEMLDQSRIPCNAFHGGYGHRAIDSQKFRNLRTQFYWIIAKKFEKGYYNLKHLPQNQYDLLKNQVCSIKVKPPDALGRTQIETKEDMMARGLKSPDYADTFMMLEYGYWSSRYDDIKPVSYR